MNHKVISVVIIAVLAVSVWGAMPVKATPAAGVPYYSTTSGDVSVLGNWNTARDGAAHRPSRRM